MRGDNNYVVAFQQPGVADELLGKNVEKAFRLFFRGDRMTAEQFAALPADSPARKFELLSALEADIPAGGKLILDALKPAAAPATPAPAAAKELEPAH